MNSNRLPDFPNRIFSAILIALSLNGCWTRLPGTGTSEMRAYVGRSATTTRPIYLYAEHGGFWSGSEFRLGEDSKNHQAVKTGSEVKSVAVVSRWLPVGVQSYLVFRTSDGRLQFDYPMPSRDPSDAFSRKAFEDTFRWQPAEKSR